MSRATYTRWAEPAFSARMTALVPTAFETEFFRSSTLKSLLLLFLADRSMPAEKRTEKTHFAAASAQLVYCSIFTSACQLVFAPQTLFFATFFAISDSIFMNTFSGGDKRTASADFSFLGSP